MESINAIARLFKNFFNSLRFALNRQSIECFCRVNRAQSDDDFIEQCFDEATLLERKVALAIRSAIAKLGEVKREFIRAEVRFEELGLLPFWYQCGDAGFDSLKLVEAIELELGCQFTERQLAKATVRDPDLNVQMKIGEFVRDFTSWYRTQL